MYQPRGVELIHTRPRPSAAHYTHAGVRGRKFWNAEKLPRTRKATAVDTCRKLPLRTSIGEVSDSICLC